MESEQIVDAFIAKARQGIHFQLNFLLTNAENTFLLWSKQARDKAEENRLYGVAREFGKKEKPLERHFQEAFEAALSAFRLPPEEAPIIDKKPLEAPKPSTFDLNSLSVVQDNSLEDNLAIAKFAGAAEDKYRFQLIEMNKRLVEHLPRDKLDINENPISPRALVEAWVSAMTQSDIQSTSRRTMVRLFERFVLDEIELVYTQCMKVLPEVEEAVQHAPVEDKELLTGLPTGQEDEDEDLVVAQPAEDDGAGSDSRTPLIAAAGKAPAMPRNVLINTLKDLQSRLLDRGRQLPAMTPRHGIAPFPLMELINDCLQEQGFNRAQALPYEDVESMKLVRLLFEAALNDPAVPGAVRKLIRLLHIPFVRAAISDQEVLNNQQHPLRLLLKELSEMGRDWKPEGGATSDPLFISMQAVIKHVIDEYDSDPAIFHEALAELRALSGTGEEVTAGSSGKDAGGELLDQLIGEADLPPRVRDFLAGNWSKALNAIHKKYGETSPQWKQVVQISKTFLGVATSKTVNSPIAAKVQDGLIKVLEALGIKHLDAKREVELLWTSIAQYEGQNSAAMRPAHERDAPGGDLPSFGDRNLGAGIQPERELGIATGGTGKPMVDTDPNRVPNQASLDLFAKMAPDTWVEFREPGQPVVRAKLLTKINKTGMFTFVGTDGKQVAELHRDQLAIAYEDKRVSLMGAGGSASRGGWRR